MKIDVGCGNTPKKGYIGIDKYPKKKVNIVAEAHDLPYKDGEVDEIRCSHMIEHILEPKVTQVLAEFNRVLKSGGELVLICPDMERMFEMWLEGDYEYRWGIGLYRIFGWQRRPGDVHYTGFNRLRLVTLLKEHGFTILKVENRPAPARKERELFSDGDLFIRARKL
jgi:SAM-dependent methyltransferase